jgi:hypothetical protein
MTITLDISAEIAAELAATARVRGLSAGQYARQVLERGARIGGGQEAPCRQNPRNLGRYPRRSPR